MKEEEVEQKVNTERTKRPWWKRVLRILSWIILLIILFFTLIVLFIRSSWGQNFVVGKITHFISTKTQTKVSIQKLFITFSGDVDLQGLYLEDKQGDTLIYSQKLSVEIPLFPIMMGNPISVDELKWSGFRANIVRKDSLEGYNFQFLIDAFASGEPAKKRENTTSEPPKINIGTIDFKNFKINYNDEVSGMKAKFDLGTFHFKGKNFDLKRMNFEVAKISLENTKLNYIQSKATEPTESTESVSPYLSLGNLKLKNVIVHYSSIPDSLEADLKVVNLALEVPKVDLRKKDVEVDKFILSNSNIQLKLNAKKKEEIQQVDDPASIEVIQEFIWPAWNVQVASISLEKNRIHFQQGEKSIETKGFKADYILLNDFNFQAKNMELSKKETARLDIKKLSFHESSGIQLKQLALDARLNPQEFALSNLRLRTGNSFINADAHAKFTSIQQLIQNPEEAFLLLNLKQFDVDLKDAYHFQPDLKNNEDFTKLARHNLSGKIKAQGKLTKIDLKEFLVKWSNNTSITMDGQFMNASNLDDFHAQIDNFVFNSTRSDLTTFVSEKDLGISIPNQVTIQSRVKGNLDHVHAKISVTIPEGKLKLDGYFKNQTDMAFDANLQVMELELGKIINNPNIGTVAFEMQAAGNGNNVQDLNAKLTTHFSKLEFSSYDYSALKLNGELNAGDGEVHLTHQDENLDLWIVSKVNLDTVTTKMDVNIQMEGADLYELGLTDKQIKAKLMMNTRFKGNVDRFSVETNITEGVAVYEEKNFQLGVFDLYASSQQDSTSLDITSNFLNLQLRSNSSIDSTSAAIQHHLSGYFSSDTTHHHDSLTHPVKLDLSLKLAETKIITDFLVPGIQTMDTLKLDVNFDQAIQKLDVNFGLPYIRYADKTVDSLKLNITSTETEANFKFGFNELDAKPFVMHQTFLDGDLKNGLLRLNFNAFDGTEEMYFVKSEISGKLPDLKIHFNPEKIIFQAQAWNVPPDNQIVISDQKVSAKNVVFSKGEESITIANDLMGPLKNNIGIGFENYKLSNLLALFNKNDLLASGEFQGNIVAVDPFENFGLNADFSIDKLVALQAPLGKLNLIADSKDAGNYNLDMSLKGEEVDLTLKGDYSKQRTGSELDFHLDVTKIAMKTIATISGENLKDASGDVSATMTLKGATTSPNYEGQISFNNAEFNVVQLNSKFRLANDQISVQNSLITLNQFSIEDKQNNTFTLDGTIKTESFTDPEFDFRVKGKNFQALNSTKEDNDLYYGKVDFDIDGTVKGNLSFPIVAVNFELNESTNFTYVIPESQAKIESRDGIVEFVNKEDPDNILTRNNDSIFASMSGMEIHANLKINKEAKFNVIVDPSTGDNLSISGVADLNFDIERNGRMTLIGRFDVQNGHYQLSLYNLVKRKFELEKGSSVVWRGDPMDAELNVTAKYKVDASASGLMASQTAGASEEVQNKYRQKLPFLVFLNVKGELDQPQLEFSLDMPEEARGAIDGTVYGRIKQLNSEEDELNKQVFSLLVLRKFYPTGSDGSEGGAAYLVRKKVNEALSDQLNAFSGKLMGNTGVELDFGLNSYTDYQGESTQQRTDLNVNAQKKLLNDRLIVQVGTNVHVEGGTNPGEENSLLGNASIQYLLTKDGRWRLKGFRNNEFENVLDGQIYVNGISVIFQRQFNLWKELFAAPPKFEDSDEGTLKDPLEKEEDQESE